MNRFFKADLRAGCDPPRGPRILFICFFFFLFLPFYCFRLDAATGYIFLSSSCLGAWVIYTFGSRDYLNFFFPFFDVVTRAISSF